MIGRGGAPALGPPHLRDSVRLKCRQSEERKSWSRSGSSRSPAPPGSAVRFLERGRKEAVVAAAQLPPEKALMAKQLWPLKKQR